MGARENHVLDLWILECDHAIECGCRHSIGLKAWCIYCDAPKLVTDHKVVNYYLARPRNTPNIQPFSSNIRRII
jgi:hypothetical protein